MDPGTTPSTAEAFRESFVLPGSTPAHPPAWKPFLTDRGLRLGSGGERVRLALRIVVHLHQFGSPSPDGEARPESTQEGVALALSVTQGAVSKVLARLAAADVVGTERRHVRGRVRRVRMYFLRPRGEELAGQIEQRFGVFVPRNARPP